LIKHNKEGNKHQSFDVKAKQHYIIKNLLIVLPDNARIIGGLVWLKLAKDERLPSVRRPLLMRLLGVFIT
jgi:hypothetical protein